MNTPTDTIAYRVCYRPRIGKIRTENDLQNRMKGMSCLDIWMTMTAPGIKGWKHKILSDEFERRRKITKNLLGGVFSYEI